MYRIDDVIRTGNEKVFSTMDSESVQHKDLVQVTVKLTQRVNY